MNSKRSINLAIVVLLISQLSCQLIAGLGSKDGGGSGYSTDPGNPLNVTIQLDSTNATQVITADGGEMSVTGSDGTRYTLTVPAGALVIDTEISMTPIDAIPDLPFSGGLGGAVKLEPSGLDFYDFITLTIEPANPIPLENQILFGFKEDGEDLHLALPGADYAKIQIRLQHFSGAGVGNGISAEKAGVMQRMADRAEVRITNQLADYLQKERQGEKPDPNVVLEALNEFYNSVVSTRLKAALSDSATCADGQKAIQTYLGFQRQRQLLGAVPEDDDSLGKLAAQVLPVVSKKCLDEEYNRCVNKHQIPGIIYFLLSLEQQAQKLGVTEAQAPADVAKSYSELRAYGEDLLQKCWQWDLEFESAGSFDAGDGMSYDSRVKSKIHLTTELPLMSLVIHGSSALINEDFTFRLTDCEVTPARGGGEFVVHTLSWVTETRKRSDGETEVFIKDFSLKYFPGNTSESASVYCPPKYDFDEATTFPIPPGPWWTSIFITTHIKEADGGEGQPAVDPRSMLEGGIPLSAQEMAFIAKNWTVYEAELMATKEWSGGSDLEPGVLEGGEFRLYHRPQK